MNATDFKKQLDRPNIRNITGSHDERFNLDSNQFNSKFLSKTPTVTCSNPLGSQIGRRTDFIQKSGDVNADHTCRADVVYNIFNKELFTLKKLDQGIPDL